MRSGFITYKHSRIHYRYSGEGPRTVLCFHGFGTFARTFDWLADHVPGHMFVAFDMPYHGETQWNDGSLLTPAELMEIIRLCPQANDQEFSLMGYSMGGRICLQLLQDHPDRVKNIVLLAPDGLHVNPWYWFSTQTTVGNRFFKKVMSDPRPFVRLLEKLASVKLLNPGVMKFVDRYLEDANVRENVYRVWTAFRRFRPHKQRIAQLINQHAIPVTLIYGRYDSIIPLAPGEAFFHLLKGRKTMEVLESGHQVLHMRNAVYIAEAFNHPV